MANCSDPLLAVSWENPPMCFFNSGQWAVSSFLHHINPKSSGKWDFLLQGINTDYLWGIWCVKRDWFEGCDGNFFNIILGKTNISAVHTLFFTLINNFIGYGRLLGKFLCMLSFKQSTNTIMLTYYYWRRLYWDNISSCYSVCPANTQTFKWP